MTTPYLLDVNLLLALTDPMHLHHNAAHRWFGETGQTAWATSPLTENGFVRVASHPAYPNRPGDVPVVLAILRELCAGAGHLFWSDDISLRDVLDPSVILTHAQITDAYLLGLAAHNGGRLATLDRHLPVNAVRGGQTALELITP
ncbi:MAG TPA: TA system VapC family ribonuclease toxin [Candidatus Methylomirabilis sp.]|nr:TA system VapC family ribonuclease toxin [Candidatus Methylomirabilis sp.]